jgi:hypothetical protein
MRESMNTLVGSITGSQHRSRKGLVEIEPGAVDPGLRVGDGARGARSWVPCMPS